MRHSLGQLNLECIVVRLAIGTVIADRRNVRRNHVERPPWRLRARAWRWDIDIPLTEKVYALRPDVGYAERGGGAELLLNVQVQELALLGRKCCDISETLELGCGVTGAAVESATKGCKPW